MKLHLHQILTRIKYLKSSFIQILNWPLNFVRTNYVIMSKLTYCFPKSFGYLIKQMKASVKCTNRSRMCSVRVSHTCVKVWGLRESVKPPLLYRPSITMTSTSGNRYICPQIMLFYYSAILTLILPLHGF